MNELTHKYLYCFEKNWQVNLKLLKTNTAIWLAYIFSLFTQNIRKFSSEQLILDMPIIFFMR